MYISIGGEEGLSLTSGVFDCIVETTREMFSRGECKCLNFIYESYDDEGQSFIKLDSVDVGCFNVFYKNCMTWHHHQDSGRMQLIPSDIHNNINHVGGNAMSQGR